MAAAASATGISAAIFFIAVVVVGPCASLCPRWRRLPLGPLLPWPLPLAPSASLGPAASQPRYLCPCGTLCAAAAFAPLLPCVCYYLLLTTYYLLLATYYFPACAPPARHARRPSCVAGKYLMMNLLIAVILTEFADLTAEEKNEAPHPTDGEQTPGFGATKFRRAAQSASDAERAQRNDPPCDYTLNLFAIDHPLRRLCAAIVRSTVFEGALMVLIVASSVCLALDSPRLDPDSPLAALLRTLDVTFTLIFVGELAAKLIAFGLANGEGARTLTGSLKPPHAR